MQPGDTSDQSTVLGTIEQGCVEKLFMCVELAYSVLLNRSFYFGM